MKRKRTEKNGSWNETLKRKKNGEKRRNT